MVHRRAARAWPPRERGALLDEVLMRANDLVFAFPALLIAILITAVFGPGAINAIIAVGLFNIPVFARLARGRGAEPVAARVHHGGPRGRARARRGSRSSTSCPTSPTRWWCRRRSSSPWASWPRRRSPMSGLGVQPPTPSWGKMLADAPDHDLARPARWRWSRALPSSSWCWASTCSGDGLRDVLDPAPEAGARLMALLEVKDLPLSHRPFPILRDIDLVGRCRRNPRRHRRDRLGQVDDGAVDHAACCRAAPAARRSIQLDGEELLGRSRAPKWTASAAATSAWCSRSR